MTQAMDSDYAGFLQKKELTAQKRGMADVPSLADHLFAFQRECVTFGLTTGSWALFLDTGLGKTACELEWCRHAAVASNGTALILTPLAVARQIDKEGKRWGYDTRVVREQRDVSAGINICNYDRLHLLDPSSFGAVALDEASILKNFVGSQSRALIEAFAGVQWRMVATATPAPNDHTELAQHASFLGVMSREEMLVRWFINDSGDTKSWRLKRHAVETFFDWMASWARMAEHPRDLGDESTIGFDLPPLRITRHATADDSGMSESLLFGCADVSATTLHDIKRYTLTARSSVLAGVIAKESDESWVVWCDTDYEADALAKVIPGAVEVRGSHSIEKKESALDDFASGRVKILITKPSVCGFGLNWQHCARMAFVGRNFSYESWYQAVRRCWRFGQARPVDVHLVVAHGEDEIGRVINRKSDDHDRLRDSMKLARRRAVGRDSKRRVGYAPTHAGRLPTWMEKTR
jgi:hypothetical protein